MLFFAIELDEERMESDGIINVESAYRCIEATFAQRDVTLYQIEGGVRYYTRNIDKHDFEYLWMVNTPFKKEDWFRYYIKTWKFMDIEDDTGELYEDEDLLEKDFSRPLRPYGENSRLLLAIELKEEFTEAGKELDDYICEKRMWRYRIKDGIRYYISIRERDDFQRLWWLNRLLKEDKRISRFIKNIKFVIETDDSKNLEIEGGLADKWVLESDMLWTDRCKLYLAISLDEKKMDEELTQRVKGTYETMDKTFRQRDVELFAVENGVRYYTREVDKNDFIYLWVANGTLKRAVCMHDCIKEWRFIIVEEDGSRSMEVDLMEDWVQTT